MHMNIKKSRRARQYTSICVLAVLCLVVGRGVWGMRGTFARAKSEATIAQKEVDKIAHRSSRAAHEVAQLEDPFGKEAALRSRFDVALPGEQLLVIVDEDHPEIAPVEPITLLDRVKAALPLWVQW
jgi:hypothetical protein